MARLFGRFDSDIRSGAGCRARDRLVAKIMYNFTGRNEPDGALRVDAQHYGDNVLMTASVVVGDESIAVVQVKFTPNGFHVIPIKKK